MTTKKQRTTRRPKTPETPAEAGLTRAVEELVASGEYNGEQGFHDLVKLVSRRFVEAALRGELDAHLKAETRMRESLSGVDEEDESLPINKRNGTTAKTLRTDFGSLPINVPRDRQGTFDPVLVPKHARHFGGLNDQIIAMYARGMSTRDIGAFLQEQYGMRVSADYVSSVTDSVLADIDEWQTRPLDSMYPVVFFDALRVKIRSGVTVKSMSVHLALGVNREGCREVLGMWIAENEGAAFWAGVFNQLRNRGVEDILIAVTDGLKGMTQAIETVFPKAEHQTCIVHLIRASTAFISYRDRKAVCNALKPIYQAVDPVRAERALEEFEASPMGQRYPSVADTWRRAWLQVVPFFRFPPEVRKLIYTTNAIEGLNRAIRKVIKTRTLFPNEDAAKKLIFLAMRNYTDEWKRPTLRWAAALPHFAIMFGERITQP